MTTLWFSSWTNLGVVVLRLALSYAAIVVILRVVGEQALAKMSAYDLIVSITLGSLVASIPFLDRLSLADGISAIVTLVILQELIRWAQARSRRVRAAIVEHPRIVLWNGKILEERLAQWNLTGREIRAAIRKQGIAHVEHVQAVVLENDGEWSVVPRGPGSDDGSVFKHLDIPSEEREMANHEPNRSTVANSSSSSKDK
jgi:uncharacterized membrane protein YcaP (DUF421 family)